MKGFESLLRWRRIAMLSFAWAIMLGVGAGQVIADALQTNIWTGAVDTDWFTAGNWDQAAVPVDGEVVIVTNTAPSILLTNATANLASLTISNATLTCSNWNTSVRADAVTLCNLGTFTLPAAFTNNQMSNRVWVVCSNFTLNTGGQIMADARGYAKSSGPGKGTDFPVNRGGGGGGYGGNGGTGVGPYAGGQSYGVTNVPLDPGSGGGCYSGTKGGDGGGAVWIDASGRVTIEGAITANGGNGVGSVATYGGAGSGGSIFISCSSFSGSGGALEAKGGSVATIGGGGGGGRISVAIGMSEAEKANLIAGDDVSGLLSFATTPSFSGTTSVTNGAGNLSDAQPGSQLFLTIEDPNKRTLIITGEPYGDPTPLGYGDSWQIDVGTVVTNSVTSPASESDGERKACTGWHVMDTDQGTPIASDVGTQAVFTVTTNVTLTWLWTNQYQLAFSTSPNGSVNSNSLNGWYTQAVQVAGIEATPASGFYFSAWVGTDVPVEEAGDNPLTLTVDRARTNITAVFASETARTMTWNGTDDWNTPTHWDPTGVPGSNDQIIIESGTCMLSSAFTTRDSVSIEDGASLMFSNWTTRLTAREVNIMSNGMMTLPAAFSDSQMSNRVWVACSSFTLHTGGQIMADARGYAKSNGPGKGVDGPVNRSSGGAGYGGKGGNGLYLEYAGGAAYGSAYVPISPGSGGGSESGYGGDGGGAVWVEAAGKATIDGTITANGGNGVGSVATWGGAGSGGSIYIDCASLRGDGGTLEAKGGSASSTGGAGGGGRIAVWIGVAPSERDLYLSGKTNALLTASTNAYFQGTVSVTNGSGYYNPPDVNAAELGSAMFFSITGRGTVIMIR